MKRPSSSRLLSLTGKHKRHLTKVSLGRVYTQHHTVQQAILSNQDCKCGPHSALVVVICSDSSIWSRVMTPELITPTQASVEPRTLKLDEGVPPPRKIVVVGNKGVGKSSVGWQSAEACHRPDQTPY